ncbi:hypothetical protein F2Q69_00026785 [Brassica cretica]|uniref:Gag1-like clamp domain-containing protein n=1 Tax=Brassica cretica TaxID=69181 RepID=A0A8S9RS55_BRACR|nr:hypothetical protein F2Q69_00026785 [Brassica cretica]
MSGQRGHVVGSKRPREVFLTSSSLSFSSLSSSCASSDDDAIEISMKTSRTSYEDQKGKVLKNSSPGSEISCVQPSPSSPSRLRPVRLMDECLGTHYDPERIPASVFAKTGDANLTNDSLISLRMSTCQAFRQSDVEPEEVLMSGDFLAYSPSLLVKTEEAEEEKRSQGKETKSAVTKTHQEKSSSSSTLPAVSWSNTNYPSSFYQLYHAPQTKSQSCPLHVGEKKSKKRKETRKSKKRKEKIIWSWFSSRFLKCNLHCCGRGKELKAISSGCVACYREPRPTETPLKDPPFNPIAQTVNKPSVSEDLWSTSTVDMDNITFPSQGGSVSSSNQTFDSQSVARNSNPPPEFVNQGLLLWNQTRERWVGKERASNRNHGSKINWNTASYESLLGSNKLFPQPIPLNEMVDFLVEVWEQDGLYD